MGLRDRLSYRQAKLAMIVAITLELLEVLSIGYKQTEEWEILGELITHKLFWSYVVFQFLIFSLIPFLMLAVNAIVKNISDKTSHILVFTSSTMLLAQVLLMRWNVVIGGQLVSKSFRGFTSFWPGLLAKEGIVVAAIILIIPFLLLRQFDKLFPFFEAPETEAPAEAGARVETT